MKKGKKLISATVTENDEYFFRDQEMFRADINDEDFEKYQLRKEKWYKIYKILMKKCNYILTQLNRIFYYATKPLYETALPLEQERPWPQNCLKD